MGVSELCITISSWCQDFTGTKQSLRKYKRLMFVASPTGLEEREVGSKEGNKRELEDSDLMNAQFSDMALGKKQCFSTMVEVEAQPCRQP